jgi:hypothetical protein
MFGGGGTLDDPCAPPWPADPLDIDGNCTI